MNLKPYFEALDHLDKVMQNQFAKFTKSSFIAALTALLIIFIFKSLNVGIITGFLIYIFLTSKNSEINYIGYFFNLSGMKSPKSRPNNISNKAYVEYIQVSIIIFDKLAKEVSPFFHYSQTGPDFSELLIKSKYFGNHKITYVSPLGNISGRHPSGALFSASYLTVGEMVYHNKKYLTKNWDYEKSLSKRRVDHFRGLVIYIEIPVPIKEMISISANNVNELHEPDFNCLYTIKCSNKEDYKDFFTREHVTGLTYFWRTYHDQEWSIKVFQRTLIFSKPYKKNPMWFGDNKDIWAQETQDFKVAAIILKDLLNIFSNSEYNQIGKVG